MECISPPIEKRLQQAQLVEDELRNVLERCQAGGVSPPFTILALARC